MDRISAGRRSENMRRIKSKGTKPELLVRQIVHGMGFRYRLHRADLPGKPDLVFGPRKKIIFVHGCFWHSHGIENCSDSRLPKSNFSYWAPKLAKNKERDAKHLRSLERLGWRTHVIWECEMRDLQALKARLNSFLLG